MPYLHMFVGSDSDFGLGKVHIFWKGHKILRNLHLTLDWQKDKSKVEISQNFVSFSEYMNFKTWLATEKTLHY